MKVNCAIDICRDKMVQTFLSISGRVRHCHNSYKVPLIKMPEFSFSFFIKKEIYHSVTCNSVCYIVTLPQAISASKLLGIPCTADLFVSSASVAASHSVIALISFRSFRDNFKHFSNSCFFSVTCRKKTCVS